MKKRLLIIIGILLILIFIGSSLAVVSPRYKRNIFEKALYSFKHFFRTRAFSVVGDDRNCHLTPDKKWTIQSGERFTKWSDETHTICESDGGLYDFFINGWEPWVEFKDSLDVTCGSGPCNIELYCCREPEPGSCPSGEELRTVECKKEGNWYRCPGELNILYEKSSYSYCKLPGEQLTCWYKQAGGCFSRGYDRSQISDCTQQTYMGRPLYNSQPECKGETGKCKYDEECPVGEVCSNGVCKEEIEERVCEYGSCSIAGVQRWIGNELYNCEGTEKLCWEPTGVRALEPKATCSDLGYSSCSKLGEKTCVGDEISECKKTTKDNTELFCWTPLVDCRDTGKACLNGVCMANKTCLDLPSTDGYCESEGDKKCEFHYGVYAVYECLDFEEKGKCWDFMEDCPSGAICSEGECKPRTGFGSCYPLIKTGNVDENIDVVLVGNSYPSVDDFVVKARGLIMDSGGILSLEPFLSNLDSFNFWYVNKIKDYNIEALYDIFSDDKTKQLRGVVEATLIKSETDLACPVSDKMIFLNAGPKRFRSFAYAGQYNAYVDIDEGHNEVDRLTVTHEFGHNFGNLADEYVEPYPYSFCVSKANCAPEGCEKWQDVTDGCLKGCGNPDAYRSSENSIMRYHWLSPKTFNEVSRKGIENRISLYTEFKGLAFLSIQPSTEYFYLLKIKLEETGDISLESIGLYEGQAPIYVDEPDEGYLLKIVDENNKSMHSFKFEFPVLMAEIPLECIDEEGNYICPPIGPRTIPILVLKIPYFKEADRIQIFDSEGVLKLEADARFDVEEPPKPKWFWIVVTGVFVVLLLVYLVLRRIWK